MRELIKALEIFSKYTDKKYPTHCEHDVLYVLIDPEIVSNEDKDKLDELGFFVGVEHPDFFMSYKYGSG